MTSYLRVAKDVKVTINGTEVTLELSHEDATKYNLPDEMILRFVGSNLCPIKTVIEPRGNSVSITREAKRFEQYGSGFEYPTEMVITFVDGSNGGKKVIFHSKISLKISAFDVSQYSFAIKFAPQASIASVVNGKTRVYTNNASNPSAGREYWFVGVGAGMLAGGGLWLAKRKRG